MQLDSNRLQQHEQVGNLGLETSFQLVRLVECGLRASVGAKLTSHAWKRFENVCLASFVIISTEDDCCYDMHHGSTPYQLDLTRIYRDWRHSGTSFRDHQRDEYGICVLVGSGVSVRSLLSYHIPARCLRSSNTNLLSVPDGYLYSAQCKWRNGENNRFRVRFRVRDMSGFDYFRHCAICIAPFGQWNPPSGSVEACDESWPPRSNATALAGFAITTTTICIAPNTESLGPSGPHNLCLLQFQRCFPSVWSSLPAGIHACSSSNTFRRLLKTHCFKQAFSTP